MPFREVGNTRRRSCERLAIYRSKLSRDARLEVRTFMISGA